MARWPEEIHYHIDHIEVKPIVHFVEVDVVKIGHAILKDWIMRWGAPIHLFSDQGVNFATQAISALCNLLSIRKSRNAAYIIQKAMGKSGAQIESKKIC